MPRRNRSSFRSTDDERPLVGGTAWARAEAGPDGEWLVRQVPGAQATKVYRCPGCDQEIKPGVSHIVAWPSVEHGSVADRRHWHSGCWSARGHRKPTSRRS